MGWLRGLGQAMGGLLLTALLVPALVIGPSAVLDRGPADSIRVSIFPLALTLFDPFVGTAVSNSVIVASLVTIGSLVVGVGLASIVESSRFWGRKPLWYLALTPLAAGPLLLAPGLNLAIGGPRAWDWLAARSIVGFSVENLVRWSLMVWVGLATGTPIVALATAACLRRIEPAWLDAARAAGASRWRIGREIVWPIVRPSAAQASAAVFVLAIVEPASPLFFGLRRTLSVQMITAAHRLDQPTQSASLALLAILIAVIGRTLISWWGGPSFPRSETLTIPSLPPSNWRRGLISWLILLAWVIFAVGPIAVMLVRSFSTAFSTTSSLWTSLIRRWLDDSELRIWVSNSATTATLALALDLVILAALYRQKTGLVRLVAQLLEGVPPLAIGVGALATPWFIAVVADLSGGVIGRSLDGIAMELSPGRSPGWLLILALAVCKLPMLAKVAELARGLARPVRIDAARLMGLSDRQASRVGQGGWLGAVPILPACLAFGLAATNLSPALSLTPFSERRTLATALFESLRDGGTLDPRIAGGLAIIFAVNLLAFGLASRSRIGSLGDWFRGG